MSNKNITPLFLALQNDNILLQQNEPLQQNKEITKQLLYLTTKFESIVKQSKVTSKVEVRSKVAVAKNTLKMLLEALQN